MERGEASTLRAQPHISVPSPPPPLTPRPHPASVSSPVHREQVSHARLLGEGGAPSYNEIATFNIILFSSLAIIFAFYFAVMALVNMDVTNDSLLYSKSKSD
jgi:hypothetical protein